MDSIQRELESSTGSDHDSIPRSESSSVSLRRRIMEAVRRGDVDQLAEIWRNHPNSEGWTSLQMQADRKDPYSGLTPLHLGVICGHERVVEVLLNFIIPDHGPGIDSGGSFVPFDFLHARTRNGQTAIHLAVASENATSEGILGILTQKYDAINKRPEHEWDFADHMWMTPLHYAVLGNLSAQTNHLLAWPEYDRHVNARDFFQRTPLHLATCHRPVRVEALLKHPGIDINAKDCLSLTPLHWAVYLGRTDVVRCLVKPLPDDGLTGKKTLRSVERDIEGRSVLEIAMEDSLLDLIPAVANIFPRLPFQNDIFFLASEEASIHCEVSIEIEKLLLVCPDVSREADTLETNLGIYVNAINAILLVAALIAGASISMGTDQPNGRTETIFYYIFYISKLLSFYLSVATILAGATILQPLGKSVPISRRVGYARVTLSNISSLLGTSVTLFIVAFYANNAIEVRKDEPSRGAIFPYHIVSGLAMAMCIGVLLWFLQLHRFVKAALVERFLVDFWTQEAVLGTFMVRVVVSVLSSSSVTSFVSAVTRLGADFINIAAGIYLPLSVSHRDKRRHNLLRRAISIYDGYFWSKCVALEVRNMDKTTEEKMEEIGNRGNNYSIKQRNFRIFESTMEKALTDIERRHHTVWEETIPIIITFRILSALGPPQPVSFEFPNRYWQRHRDKVRPNLKRFILNIEKDIVELEKVYVDLSLSWAGEDRRSGRYVFVMDRHFMDFLDRLPRGLLFWLPQWEEEWAEHIAVFCRGYILERDFRIWSESSHQIRDIRTRFMPQ